MSEWLEIEDPDIETIASVVTSILFGAIKENENLCPCCIIKETIASIIQNSIVSEAISMEEIAETVTEAMNDMLPDDDTVH